MFAGAPAALRPLTELGQAILLHAELDPRLRQIAILTVARATGSGYERAQHEQVTRALGVSDADVRAASAGDLDALDEEERRRPALRAPQLARLAPGPGEASVARE